MSVEAATVSVNLELLRRKRISISLLVVAATGLIASRFGLIPIPSHLSAIIEHAFEGALVGGLCDWFAVKKTYAAIQSNHATVADGIGRYIKQEVLNAGVMRARVISMLDSQETMIAVRDKVSVSMPSEKKIADAIRGQWKPLRDPVYKWIAGLDLTEGGYARL
jgi:hypothetical protein